MATPRALPGSPASLRELFEGSAPPAPVQPEAVRFDSARLDTTRLEAVRLEAVRLGAARIEAVPVAPVPRVPNPFARFRTRSMWLSRMIRAGREANPAPRDVPEWFNV